MRRPERFDVTWEHAEQVSWVTVTLSPAADGTTLEVAHEAPVDPAFAFVRHVATGWARAAVADGDDVAAAHDAAENTVVFDTVEPEA